jgi:hypothetical protein
MPTTEGIEENTLILFHNLFSCNNTSHWETVAHTFGHCNNIWFEASPSMAPKLLSDSTEACLNFISNNDTTVFSN